MHRLGILLIFGVLGCALAACGATPPVSTPVPTATPSLVIDDSFVITIDEKDTEEQKEKKKAWTSFEDADLGSAQYKDGSFYLKVTKQNGYIWTNPKNLKPVADVRIEARAEKVNGDDNNLFGVICRYQDDKNFYFFLISSDGHFGIGKVVLGNYSLINRWDYPPSDLITKGEHNNTLLVECIGDTLRLMVNDKLLDEQQDTDLKTGNIGLIAATLGGATEIKFDDIKAWIVKP